MNTRPARRWSGSSQVKSSQSSQFKSSQPNPTQPNLGHHCRHVAYLEGLFQVVGHAARIFPFHHGGRELPLVRRFGCIKPPLLRIELQLGVSQLPLEVIRFPGERGVIGVDRSDPGIETNRDAYTDILL